MSEAARSQETPRNKRRVYIILAVVVTIIALLATLCASLTPSRLWGPRILRDSPVDISLIERLDGHVTYFGQEEMEAWMEAVDQREGILGELRGNLLRDESGWESTNADGAFGSYSFGDGFSNAFNRARINGGYYSSAGQFFLGVYDTVENAEERIQWERERGTRSNVKAQYITISDNVEATLRSVHWNRSSHPPFLYVSSEKTLYTRIRVGNVVIRAFESSANPDIDLIGTSTNLALEQIVEALESLNLQED